MYLISNILLLHELDIAKVNYEGVDILWILGMA
jgi:hypothetical protein